MMPDRYPEHLSPEVITAIEAVIDSSATPEQFERLQVLLEQDPAVRTLFLDYSDLQAALMRRFGQPDEEAGDLPLASPDATLSPTATPVPTHRGGSAWSRIGFAMAATLLLIAGSLGLRGVLFDISDQSRRLADTAPTVSDTASGESALAEDQRASLNGLAVLTHSVDVEWSDGSPTYAKGSPVPAGNLSIDSGLIQIEFYCGAVTVIEGPASFDLLTADRGFLRSGKFRARVPKQARGFTILTRSGDIEDLGTEFAIDMPSDDALAEVHVLDGEVRFHPKEPNPGKPPRHLLAGQALQFDDENTKLVAAANRFIGSAELESLARQQAKSWKQKWQTHRQELLADPALVALYGHSPEPRWSRMLRNYAPKADDDSHGAIVGCSWVPGRWKGTKALRFRNASHRVCVNVPGEHRSLTLATWVAIDDFHPTNNIALIHPDLDQKSVIHWTIDRGVEGATLHFAESVVTWDPKRRQHYNSTRHGVSDKHRDQWIHLAMVYDADRRLVSHYSNGNLIGTKPIEKLNPLSIGIANLGNWPYRDWAKGTEFEVRNLNGRMDEFVILSRAMQDAEIAAMHRVGKPR